MKNICPAHLKIYEIVVRLTFYSCSITFLHNDCAIIYILYTYIYIFNTRNFKCSQSAYYLLFSGIYTNLFIPPPLWTRIKIRNVHVSRSSPRMKLGRVITMVLRDGGKFSIEQFNMKCAPGSCTASKGIALFRVTSVLTLFFFFFFLKAATILEALVSRTFYVGRAMRRFVQKNYAIRTTCIILVSISDRVKVFVFFFYIEGSRFILVRVRLRLSWISRRNYSRKHTRYSW